MQISYRAYLSIGRPVLILVSSLHCLGSVSLAQEAGANLAAGMDCQAASATSANLTAGECPKSITVMAEDAGNRFEQNQPEIALALVLGPKPSITDARKLFEKSARQGYAPAQVNLGVLYANGWGTARNYGAALYWLKAAADQGSARAKTNLGILYMQGLGVKQDYADALRYFRSAAEDGDTGGMINLGFLSDSGLGVPVDHAVAAAWYRKAAENGDPLGQNNLADLYLRGEGVPQSDAQAMAWFQKAADNGNTGARIKLGYMYATGRATPKDLEAAYVWILAASLVGDRRGDEYLPALRAELSPDQLARAKQHAEELQTTPRIPAGERTFVQ